MFEIPNEPYWNLMVDAQFVQELHTLLDKFTEFEAKRYTANGYGSYFYAITYDDSYQFFQPMYTTLLGSVLASLFNYNYDSSEYGEPTALRAYINDNYVLNGFFCSKLQSTRKALEDRVNRTLLCRIKTSLCNMDIVHPNTLCDAILPPIRELMYDTHTYLRMKDRQT